MKALRKIGRILLRVFLVLVSFFLLLLVLLYMPPVQQGVKRAALSYARSATGWDITLDRILLRFPLGIRLENLRVLQPSGDTLASVGSLKADVQPLGLLRMRAALPLVELERVGVDFRDTLSGMHLKASLGALQLKGTYADLRAHSVQLGSLSLRDANLLLAPGAGPGLPSGAIDAGTAALQLKAVRVNLLQQQVALEDFSGEGLYAGLLTAAGSDPLPEDSTDSSGVSGEWTVRVGRIRLTDSRFSMRPEGEEGKSAVFPEQIHLVDLALEVDSVYNRMTDVQAAIRSLRFREQSGVELRDLSGRIGLDSSRMEVAGLEVRLPQSHLRLSGRIGCGLEKFSLDSLWQVSLAGTFGFSDLLPLLPPSLPHQALLADKPWQLAVEAAGGERALSLTRGEIRLPGVLEISASGAVRRWESLPDLSGDILLNGRLSDAAYLAPFFTTDTLSPAFVLPSGSIRAAATARAGELALDLDIFPELGSWHLSAGCGLRDSTYHLKTDWSQFDLSQLFPRDSLGKATASVQLSGKGWQLPGIAAALDVRVDSLPYKQTRLDGVAFQAQLESGKLQGRISSPVEALDLDVGLEAALRMGRDTSVTVSLQGDVRRVDLHALSLAEEPLNFSLAAGITGQWHNADGIRIQAVLPALRWTVGENTHAVDTLGLSLRSGRDSVRASVEAPELSLTLESGTGQEDFLRLLGGWMPEVNRQLADRHLDMARLRAGLPDFTLDVDAGRNSILNRLAGDFGLFFHHLRLGLYAPPGEPLKSLTSLRGIAYNAIRMDSLAFDLRQQEHALEYGLRVYNTSDFLRDVSLFSFAGKAEENSLTLYTRELNRKGEPIVAMGFRVASVENDFRVTLADTLILAYTPWTVNPENGITWRPGGLPTADLQLRSGSKYALLQSAVTAGTHTGIRLDLEQIDLGLLTTAFSLLPPMQGTLDTRLQFSLGVASEGTPDPGFYGGGTVQIDSFYYGGGRIGDLGLDLAYAGGSLNGVKADLSLDQRPVVKISGSVGSAETAGQLALRVEVPGFPLAVTRAFVPEELLSIGGELTGVLAVGGTFEKPLLDGYFGLRESEMLLGPLNTTFRWNDSLVTVAGSLFDFNGLSLLSPNRQPLRISGTVDLSDFSAIRTDLSLTTRNFQFLKAPVGRGSILAGSGYADVDLTVKGVLEALDVRGNVDLLERSDVTYTLQDSPLSMADRSSDLVHFTSFSDTLFTHLPDREPLASPVAPDVRLALGISPRVLMTLNLSEDGENGLTIQGGGTLNFAMNRLGDMTLMGRYSLTDGTVAYRVPVIGVKRFAVTEGNYVEWSGDLLNPQIQIVATEKVKVSLMIDEQPQSVDFTVIVRIGGSLEKPSLVFDLAAEGNALIRNQVAAMTEEERSRQALNVLITGTYSAQGVETASASASQRTNEMLNNVLERELNNWSRQNLKGVDLSFGIDSYDQAGEGGSSQRTDYSYQFSKRFFNDRVQVKVGGRITTDNDPSAGEEVNLVDDVSIEYYFSKNNQYLLRIFRHTGYESILEGEVTQTGIGLVLRKQYEKYGDIFRKKRKQSTQSNQQTP